MSTIYGSIGNDNILGDNSGALNALFGNRGDDVLRIVNPPSTVTSNHMHGEAGRDILLTNAQNNGSLPNPLSIISLSIDFISGGTGSDIIKNYYNSTVTGTSVYVSDSRFFDPTSFALKTNLTGVKQFLEGGHDVLHGSTSTGMTDVLQLRGAGWEIRFSDGTVVNSSNQNSFFTQDTTLPNLQSMNLSGAQKAGVAMVNLTNSDDPSQNKLHTINFDSIERIVLFDAKLGGSNTDFGWANSTTTQNSIDSTTYANFSVKLDSSGSLFFGKNVNGNFNGTNLDNVIYAGAGNKTINANGGNDTIFAGQGNQVLKGGSGDDTFVLRDADLNSSAPATIQVWGGNNGGSSIMGIDSSAKDWLDISALKGSVNIFYSNGTALKPSAIADLVSDNNTSSGVIDLSGNQRAGTIQIGNKTIEFHGIERIIY